MSHFSLKMVKQITLRNDNCNDFLWDIFEKRKKIVKVNNNRIHIKKTGTYNINLNVGMKFLVFQEPLFHQIKITIYCNGHELFIQEYSTRTYPYKESEYNYNEWPIPLHIQGIAHLESGDELIVQITSPIEPNTTDCIVSSAMLHVYSI